jgi:hypothetical protein
MRTLIERLGNVDAEKFISLIIKEPPFDYVKWRQDLYEDMTIEEIAQRAKQIGRR